MSQYCSRIDNDCPVWDEEDPGNAMDVLRRENGKLRNRLAKLEYLARTVNDSRMDALNIDVFKVVVDMKAIEAVADALGEDERDDRKTEGGV